MSDGGDGSGGEGAGGGASAKSSPAHDDPSSPAAVDSPSGGGQAEAASAQEEAEAQPDDGAGADDNAVWEAVQDDEGRTYYYNTASGESSWVAPPGFAGGAVAVSAAASEQEPGGSEPAAGTTTEGQEGQQPQRWTGYKDDEGRTYYYNEATGETQWERPAEGPDVVVVEEEDMEAEAFEADASSQQQTGDGGRASSESPMEEGEYVADEGAMEVDDDETGERKKGVEVEKQVPEEEMKDPRQVALENAEEALAARDAVMELGESFLHMYYNIYIYICVCVCLSLS